MPRMGPRRVSVDGRLAALAWTPDAWWPPASRGRLLAQVNVQLQVAGRGSDAGAQILALVHSDEKNARCHTLTAKWQRNLLVGRHFLHPAFYSAGNQNALLAVL